MLFLIINFTIGKYYPNFLTQFIIGCVLYIFLLFVLTEFVPNRIYEKYKYHGLALIVIDFAYLIYKTKYANENMDADASDKKEKTKYKIIFTDEKSASNIVTASENNKSDASSVKNVTTPTVINGLELTDSDINNIFSASSITATGTDTEKEKDSETIIFGNS